jgi:hypothetical protein
MPVDRLRIGPFGLVAGAGQAGDLQAPRLLRGHDRPGAERIAAVKRQAVIEHVEDAHGPRYAR